MNTDTFSEFINSTMILGEKNNSTILEIFEYENEKNKLSIINEKNLLNLRFRVGKSTLNLVWFWVFIIMFFIYLNGAKMVPFINIPFNISDSVLITLITTTTINVLVLLKIITISLFPEKKK